MDIVDIAPDLPPPQDIAPEIDETEPDTEDLFVEEIDEDVPVTPDSCACTTDLECTGEAGECKVIVCKDCACVEEDAVDGTPCDDGDACTANDNCQGGLCEKGEIACKCATSEDCVAFEDGNLCNGTLMCDTSIVPYACVVDLATVVTCTDDAPEPCKEQACDTATGTCGKVDKADDTACDDADPCTAETKCIAGACAGGTPTLCDDLNPCTDDSCDPTLGCVKSENTASCEDSDPCTVGDACSGGVCVGGGPNGCDDQNPCTFDSCTPGVGCAHEIQQGKACNDSDACTIDDACDASGACTGSPKSCDDDNQCTKDTCSGGSCKNDIVKGEVCNDANACTVQDTCDVAGVCKGSAMLCNDKNTCTKDTCVDGACVFAPLPAGPCNDNNACTASDTCSAEGICVGTPKNCDDGLFCNGVEGCNPVNGACYPGEAPTCNDNNVCTSDACSDEAKGCAFTQKPGAIEGPKGDAACDDGEDNDCDNLIDLVDPDCAFEINNVVPSAVGENLEWTVTVVGDGFDGATKVTFGGNPGTNLVVTPKFITVVTPKLAAGKVKVAVFKGILQLPWSGDFVLQGTKSTLTNATLISPVAVEITEGQPAGPFAGRVAPGSKKPDEILADMCYGPVGTYPWQSTAWACVTGTYNASCSGCGADLEYTASLDAMPSGNFDVYWRFTNDAGLNWRYADKNGATGGTTTDQAGKLFGYSIAQPGDVVVNEIMWMGSNIDTAAANDEWIELRNLTNKTFKVSGWSIINGKGTTDLVVDDSAFVVNNLVLGPKGYFLITRLDQSISALGVKGDVIANTMSLPNTAPKTYGLKNQDGVALDTVQFTALVGYNGKNAAVEDDKSMSRLWDPGDGTKDSSWATASCQVNWGGIKDNAHNWGTPKAPNCDAPK